MVKKVVMLTKQNSDWSLAESHTFNSRNYKVSSNGDFYSNDVMRVVKCDPKNSYWHHLVNDKGEKTRFKKHQIVMQTFYPEGVEDFVTVDHINRDRHNNTIENLRYATREQQCANRENISHKRKAVLCIENGIEYESAKGAEDCLEITRNTVARVCRGERKSTCGYTFKFKDSK